MGYIAADDVDAMATRLEQEGGKIMRPPCDVPGVIRFAVVADSQGAGFLIAKGLVADAPPPLSPTAMGNVGWRELYAGEWQSAFAFYEKLFGWTKADSYDMGPMGTYQLFATPSSRGGAEPVGGMMTKPPQIPHPNWGFYFNVPAIDAAIARVQDGGGTILHGPVEVPGPQWIIQALDPQGAYFGLLAPAR
jgi:predicted enzyme related to lactoylglutathione lyase